jgi:spermidine synthase
LAGATLGLQVGLTRHFSFLYWHHFAFMIIGIGMLGFGAAGAWLARGGGISDGPSAHARAAWASVCAALAVLGYLWLGPRVNFAPLQLLNDGSQFGQLLLLYTMILIPFTALGLAQGSIIAGYRAHAHRVYGADLVGASLGCLLTLGLLAIVSATTTLMLWGACAAVSGGLLSLDAQRARRMVPWLTVAVVLGLAASGWADARYFIPAPSKDIASLFRRSDGEMRRDMYIEHTVSSSTVRLDVTRPRQWTFSFGGNVAWPPARPGGSSQRILPVRWVFQDGAAPTILHALADPEGAEFLGLTNQSLAYQIRNEPRVCVIGAGGGADLLIALHHGARSVTAVELNPQMLALGRKTYRDFVHGLFQRHEITPIVAEGRHFLGRGDEQFDLIQMSGVDTFAALASGAYAMAEDYLYTVEAGQAVLRALESDGLFSSSRWYQEPPRETLRLVNVLAEALRREGVLNPANHLFVIRAETWGTTLMSRRPFTEAELETLRAWTADRKWTVALDPDGTGADPFVKLVHGTTSESGAFLRTYPYNVSPTTDDHPFFFQFYRWSNLISRPKTEGGYSITRLPVGYAVLGASLIQMVLLSTLCILGPLWSQRSRLRDQPHRARRFAFFAALGTGFMAIEITSLQAFTVFLGFPIYSMAITLAALLAATGAGALWAGRRNAAAVRLVRNALVGVTAWALLTAVLLDSVLAAAIGWPLPFRAVLVALWLLPVGLVLGVPFPTAIRALQAETPALVPWAWGINACASVLASLAVVLLSMQIGFRMTLMVAAGLYWCGYLCWRSTITVGGHAAAGYATAGEIEA